LLIYTLKRLLALVPMLFVISVIIFSLLHIMPGHPAAALLGLEATIADQESLNIRLGLDQPLVTQYLVWISGLSRGDLGESLFLRQPVSRAVAEHIGPTMQLAFVAQLLALLLALPLGVFAAARRGTPVDALLRMLTLMGIAIPGFLLGLFLMLIFAVGLSWLPVAGYEPLSAGLWLHLRYLLLPGLALALVQAAVIMRMTRASVLGGAT
jgi:peptide/nickel transport system permease protein